MIIEDQNKPHILVEFSSIPVGSSFFFDNKLYFKTTGGSFCFETGELLPAPSDSTVVTRIVVKLTWKFE